MQKQLLVESGSLRSIFCLSLGSKFIFFNCFKTSLISVVINYSIDLSLTAMCKMFSVEYLQKAKDFIRSIMPLFVCKNKKHN